MSGKRSLTSENPLIEDESKLMDIVKRALLESTQRRNEEAPMVSKKARTNYEFAPNHQQIAVSSSRQVITNA